MTVEEVSDILLRLIDGYERFETENLALRAVLQFAVPRPGEPGLQRQVADLIEDARNGPVHQRYDDLRRQIRQAAEDRQLIELLQQFPPAGRAN